MAKLTTMAPQEVKYTLEDLHLAEVLLIHALFNQIPQDKVTLLGSTIDTWDVYRAIDDVLEEAGIDASSVDIENYIQHWQF